MRDIKFRIWDKEPKKMIYLDKGYPYHHSFSIGEDGKLSYYNLQNGSGGDEYIIMQYTGKQFQGTEIYEGDILLSIIDSVDGPLIDYGLVYWDEEKAGFYISSSFTDDMLYTIDDYWFDGIKGNLYENPELLG